MDAGFPHGFRCFLKFSRAQKKLSPSARISERFSTRKFGLTTAPGYAKTPPKSSADKGKSQFDGAFFLRSKMEL